MTHTKFTTPSSNGPASASAADVSRAADLLRAGHLVAFPTETVYGLGADAENATAVARIFATKRRPANHPLILHIGSPAQLSDWTSCVPEAAKLLAGTFWPGPLTLVLPRGNRVPLSVTGGLESVAVRVPSHPIARDLLRNFGSALAAPSANRFGSVSPTSAEHVREDLGTDVDFILDGGPCTLGLESTIVEVRGTSTILLRPGGVTLEQLESALGGPVLPPALSSTRVSGSHPSHYAPLATVKIVEFADLKREAEQLSGEGQRLGVLLPPGTPPVSLPDGTVMRAPATLPLLGQSLYALLREFDHERCASVLVVLPPEAGLGAAIRDRLCRAAGPRANLISS